MTNVQCLNHSDPQVRLWIENVGKEETYRQYVLHNESLPDWHPKYGVVPFQDATNFLSNIIPSPYFYYKRVKDNIDKLPLGVQAAFWKDTFYFRDSITKGELAEEAFHSIINTMFSDTQREEFYKKAEEHIIKNGTTVKVSPEVLKPLTPKQRKERIIEETIAQDFREWYNEKRPYGWLVSTFGSTIGTYLQELFMTIGELFTARVHRGYIDQLFKDIRTGKYKNSNVVYRETESPLTYTIVGMDVDGRMVEVNESESDQIIRNLKATYISIKQETTLSKQEALDEAFRRASLIYSESKPYLSEAFKKKNLSFDEETFEDIEIDNPEYKSLEKEVLKRIEKSERFIFDIIEEDSEDSFSDENEMDSTKLEQDGEDTAGVDYSDRVSANERGFENISKWTRAYIEQISISEEVTLKDGTQIPFIQAVNPVKIYYGTARALNNSRNDFERFIKLIAFGELGGNSESRALLEKVMRDITGKENIQPIVDAIKNDYNNEYLVNGDPSIINRHIVPERAYVLNNILKGFNLWSRTTLFQSISPETGNTYTSNENVNNAIQNQLARWQQNFISKPRDFSRVGDLVDKITNIGNYTNRLNKTVIENKKTLEEALGITLSEATLKWLLIHSSGIDGLSAKDKMFYNIFKQEIEKYDTEATLLTVFSKMKTGLTEEDFIDTYENQTISSRLKLLSRINALFDESVFESSYRTADGKTAYGFQWKTFDLEFIANLQDDRFTSSLLNNGSISYKVDENGNDVYLSESLDFYRNNRFLSKMYHQVNGKWVKNPNDIYTKILSEFKLESVGGMRQVIDKTQEVADIKRRQEYKKEYIKAKKEGNRTQQELAELRKKISSVGEIEGGREGDGVTFSNILTKHFDAWRMNSMVNRQRKVNNEVLYLHYIANLEAKKTADMVYLPKMKGDIVTGDTLGKDAIDGMKEEIRKEYDRITRVNKEFQEAIRRNPDAVSFNNKGVAKITSTVARNLLSTVENGKIVYKDIYEKYHTGNVTRTSVEGEWVYSFNIRALEFTDNTAGILDKQYMRTTLKDSAISGESLNTFWNKESLDDKLVDHWKNVVLKMHMDHLINNGVIDFLDNEWFEQDENTKRGAFKKEMFNEYIVSSFLNVLAFNQLMHGDTALTIKNDGVDFTKRKGGANAAISNFETFIIAPQLGIYDVKDKYRFVVGNEMQSVVSYDTGYTVLNDDGEEEFIKNTIDTADAQNYGTTKYKRYSLWSTGKLDKFTAEVLDYVELGIPLTDGQKNRMKKEKIYLNVDKTVAYNGHQYLKKADLMLTKEFTSVLKEEALERLEGLSPLSEESRLIRMDENNWIPRKDNSWHHHLRQSMEGWRRDENNILYQPKNSEGKLIGEYDLYMPPSASKMLNINIFDPSTGWNNIDSSIVHIGAKDYGLQLENPAGKTKVVDPSQMLEIIYNEQREGVEVWHKGKLVSIESMGTLFRKYLEMRDKPLLELANTEIFDKDGKFDSEKFFPKMLSGLINSGADPQIIQLLQIENGKPVFNPNMGVTQEKFTNAIFAHFSKGVLQQKVAGDAVAHFSSHGIKPVKKVVRLEVADKEGKPTGKYIYHWEVVQRDSDVYKEITYGRIPLTDLKLEETDYKQTIYDPTQDSDVLRTTLQTMYETAQQNGSGDIYFIDELRHLKPKYVYVDQEMSPNLVYEKPQAYFTESVMPMLGEEGNIATKENKYMLGVRIPSQDKHSATNVEVVSVLPEYYGNTIVVAKEIVNISGSDFDIDKLFLHKMHLYKDIDGKYVEFGKGDKRVEFIEFMRSYSKDFDSQMRGVDYRDDVTVNGLLLKLRYPINENTFNNPYTINNELLELKQIGLTNEGTLKEQVLEDGTVIPAIYKTAATMDILKGLYREEVFQVRKHLLATPQLLENIGKYYGERIQLVEELTTKKGDSISIRRHPTTGVLFISLKNLMNMYDNKTWTTTKTFLDGSESEVLPEDTYESFSEFLTASILRQYYIGKIDKESDETRSEYESRISSETLKEISKIKSAKKESFFTKDDPFPNHLFQKHSDNHKKNTTGKANISPYVNGNSGTSFAISAGYKINKGFEVPINGHRGDSFKYLNAKNQRVFDIISSLTSAATDEAKEMLNALYNLNLQGANIVKTLISLGHSLETSIAFVNQPILQKLLNLLEDRKQLIYKDGDLQFKSNDQLIEELVGIGQSFEGDYGNEELTLGLEGLSNREFDRRIIQDFQKVMDIAAQVTLLTKVLKIRKGISKGLDQLDELNSAVSGLGLNIDTDKGRALFGETHPINTQYTLSDKNISERIPQVVNYVRTVIPMLNNVSKKLLLRRDESLRDSITKVIREFKPTLNIFDKKAIEKEVHSYLFMRLYLEESVNTPFLSNSLFLKKKGVDTVGETLDKLRKEVNRVELLTENLTADERKLKKLVGTSILKRLTSRESTFKVDKVVTTMVELKMDTFARLSPDEQDDLIESYAKMTRYLQHLSDDYADFRDLPKKIFAYWIMKEAFQNKYGSVSKLFPTDAFTEHSTSIDRAMNGRSEFFNLLKTPSVSNDIFLKDIMRRFAMNGLNSANFQTFYKPSVKNARRLHALGKYEVFLADLPGKPKDINDTLGNYPFKYILSEEGVVTLTHIPLYTTANQTNPITQATNKITLELSEIHFSDRPPLTSTSPTFISDLNVVDKSSITRIAYKPLKTSWNKYQSIMTMDMNYSQISNKQRDSFRDMSLEPKGAKLFDGVYFNDRGLSQVHQIQLFDYLKPLIEKSDSDKLTLSYIPEFVKSYISVASGIDVVDYDSAEVEVITQSTPSKTTIEDLALNSTENFPVISVNIGGDSTVFLKEEDSPQRIVFEAGSVLVYGFEGDNREVEINTKSGLSEGFLPQITKDSGVVYPDRDYRINVILKRNALVKDGSKPSMYIQETLTEDNQERFITKYADNGLIKFIPNPLYYTNHSGGAEGSDTVWDIVGNEFGVIKHKHYLLRKDNTVAGKALLEKGVKPVFVDEEVGVVAETGSEVGEGQLKATIAGRQLGRIDQHQFSRDSKTIRNWSQVKNSDAIFAIGNLVDAGHLMQHGKAATIRQVEGSTGYAVQMAINEDKTVYVFDQKTNKWFHWDGSGFVNIETPILTRNFAGIGTSEITSGGKKAIYDVYNKTFNSETERNTERKIKIATKKYAIKKVRLNPNNAFVFGENTYSMEHYHDTVGGGYAVVRPEPNGYPIVISKKFDYETRVSEPYQDTEEDFTEFVKINTHLINKLKDSGRNITFPEGFANKGLQMPTRFAEWLRDKLYNNFGLITVLTDGKDGLVSKGVEELSPYKKPSILRFHPTEFVFSKEVFLNDQRVNTQRIKDSELHFGNPFSSSNKTGLSVGSVPEALEAYRLWLEGEGTVKLLNGVEVDVSTIDVERKKLIDDLINAGYLDGKYLISINQNPNAKTTTDILLKYIIENQKRRGDIDTSKDLSKYVSQSVLAPTPVYENPKEFIGHSGDGIGDSSWNIIGNEFGVDAYKHYVLSPASKLSDPRLLGKGVMAVNADEYVGNVSERIETDNYNLGEGQIRATDAAIQLGRIDNGTTSRKKDTIVNWAQVKNSDALFAVSTMIRKGEVMKYGRTASIDQFAGGVGYTVQMAIIEGKPVYVFDQNIGLWYTWDGSKFVNTEIPTLTKNFGAVALSDINQEGEDAIRDVYEKTFGTKPASSVEKTFVITSKKYTVGNVRNDPNTAYVFTENNYSITHFPHIYGGGSALIRPLPNSYAIVTKKKYDYDTKERVDYENTEEDFTEFKEVNTRLIKELKDANKDIVFPQGFASDKAQIPLRFAEWLQKELYNNFGLVTKLNSNNTGLISVSIEKIDPEKYPTFPSGSEELPGSQSNKEDTTEDFYYYYGSMYIIIIDSEGKGIGVKNYKQGVSKMQKILDYYNTDKDSDPQTGKKFRNSSPSSEQILDEVEKQIIVPLGSNPNNMVIFEDRESKYLMNNGQQESYNKITKFVRERIGLTSKMTTANLLDTMVFKTPATKQFSNIIPKELYKNFIGLQGYGGTGKTTVIKKIIDDLQAEVYDESTYTSLNVAYLGPTHISATMLQESLGMDSESIGGVDTIASYLRLDPDETGKSKGFVMRSKQDYIRSTKFKPAVSSPDVIVVDESSMFGTETMQNFVTRLMQDQEERGGVFPVVIFMGDYHQLSPIGEDNDVKLGIISSTVLRNEEKSAVLTEMMRTSDNNQKELFTLVANEIDRYLSAIDKGDDYVMNYSEILKFMESTRENILSVESTDSNKDLMFDTYVKYLLKNNNPDGMFYLHYNAIDNNLSRSLSHKIREKYLMRRNNFVPSYGFGEGEYIVYVGGQPEKTTPVSLSMDLFNPDGDKGLINLFKERDMVERDKVIVSEGVVKPSLRYKILKSLKNIPTDVKIVFSPEFLSEHSKSVNTLFGKTVPTNFTLLYNRQSRIRAFKSIDFLMYEGTKPLMSTSNKKYGEQITVSYTINGEKESATFNFTFSAKDKALKKELLSKIHGNNQSFEKIFNTSYIGSTHSFQGAGIVNPIVGVADIIKYAKSNSAVHPLDVISSLYTAITRTKSTLTLLPPMKTDTTGFKGFKNDVVKVDKPIENEEKGCNSSLS